MEDDRLYTLHGEVQALKTEVSKGFISVEKALERMANSFQEHLMWVEGEKDKYIEERDRQAKEHQKVKDRIKTIELRLGLIVTAIVVFIESAGRWLAEHAWAIIHKL